MKTIVFFFLSSFLLVYSCTKDPQPPQGPSIGTAFIDSVTYSSAISGGVAISDNGFSITEKGVCWSTFQGPTIADYYTSDGSGSSNFRSNLRNLAPATKYYVRAYAKNASGVGYGNELTFTTLSQSKPVLTTNAVSNISQNTATSGGNITDDGGREVTERGICWNTSGNPSISNSRTLAGSGTGNFSANLSSLSPGITYYVRAYAINSVGVSYGNQVSFVTSSISTPTVTTASISSITLSTAAGGGNVTATGGAAVSARGICWSTSPNPTLSNSYTNSSSGTGSFTSYLSNLSPSTTYYVRAYATNSAGTAYGNQVSFSTLSPSLPTVTTTTAYSITQTSAYSGGNVSGDGGSAVTAKGICWNTTGSPTTLNSKTNDGVGVGSYSSYISALSPGVTYYVRSYATNSVGTSYGNQISFTTNSITVPTVSTSSIYSITQNSAASGGNVSSAGGGTVSARGVCWNTTGSPTTANSKTVDGSGTGTFNSTLTGLSASTTYYVRAYATNSAGTSYGNQYNFTTSAPSLSAPSLTSPSNGGAVPCCYMYFNWTSVTGATSYELQLSKNSSFPTSGTITLTDCGGSGYPSTVAVNRAITSVNNFCANTGGSTNNGTWYWRVRAISGTTQGPWSTVYYYIFTW